MEFTKVESSMIAEIAHQSESETLFVRFKNGSLYFYEDVSKPLFDELLNSESKGKFLNNNIKKDHVHRRVGEQV